MKAKSRQQTDSDLCKHDGIKMKTQRVVYNHRGPRQELAQPASYLQKLGHLLQRLFGALVSWRPSLRHRASVENLFPKVQRKPWQLLIRIYDEKHGRVQRRPTRETIARGLSQAPPSLGFKTCTCQFCSPGAKTFGGKNLLRPCL